MNIGKLVGWGIVIYAIVFLAWSGLMSYGVVGGYLSTILIALVIVGASLAAGRALHFDRWPDIVPYSLGWAVIVAILDAVFSVPFSGWDIYYDPYVWAGYALVVLAPLFAPLFGAWRNRP